MEQFGNLLNIIDNDIYEEFLNIQKLSPYWLYMYQTPFLTIIHHIFNIFLKTHYYFQCRMVGNSWTVQPRCRLLSQHNKRRRARASPSRRCKRRSRRYGQRSRVCRHNWFILKVRAAIRGKRRAAIHRVENFEWAANPQKSVFHGKQNLY